MLAIALTNHVCCTVAWHCVFHFPFFVSLWCFQLYFLIFVVDGHLRDKSIANYDLCLVPKRLWKLGLAP